jgi:hypothetical protein
MEGFSFYVNNLKDELAMLTSDRLELAIIANIRRPEALPILLDLLTAVKRARGDSMNLVMLEDSILKAFNNISQQSDTSFSSVIASLRQYIHRRNSIRIRKKACRLKKR